MLEVPTTVAFGVCYLGEPLTWRLLLGGALILGASFYVTVRPARRPGPLPAPRAAVSGGPPAGRG
jgi:drug/metabolite transporter (DMT)-like permease